MNNPEWLERVEEMITKQYTDKRITVYIFGRDDRRILRPKTDNRHIIIIPELLDYTNDFTRETENRYWFWQDTQDGTWQRPVFITRHDVSEKTKILYDVRVIGDNLELVSALAENLIRENYYRNHTTQRWRKKM